MSYFWKRGYYVQRAYASKGVFDIIAVPPKGGFSRPFLIQAKGDQKQGYIKPEERTKLKAYAKKYNAYCLIAFRGIRLTKTGQISKNRRLKFKLIPIHLW